MLKRVFLDDALNVTDDVSSGDTLAENANANDRWATFAIETLGQKFIANKERDIPNGGIFSIIPINPDPNDPRPLNEVDYIQHEEGRFRINVTIVQDSKKSTGKKSGGVKKSSAPKGMGPNKSKQSKGIQKEGKPKPPSTRKAVAAKKPSSTLTAAGRRILMARQSKATGKSTTSQRQHVQGQVQGKIYK